MLATGLAILKIIGLILLGILALALAIVLAVLFVPVRYRVSGSHYDEWKATVRFSWLLHILSFHADYDGGLTTSLRIFGFRLGRSSNDEDFEEDEYDSGAHHKTDDIKDTNDTKEHVIKEQPAESSKDSAKISSEEPPKDSVKVSSEEPPKDSAKASPEEPPKDSPSAPPEEPSKRRARRKHKKPRQKKSASKKKTFSITKIYDKLKAVKGKIIEVYELLKKEEKSLKLIWKQFITLIKHISPRRIKGQIRFGFDDPYQTGQVLTYISPFYGRYLREVSIIPVFEEAVLDGELYIRGRIRLGTAIWIVLMLWRDAGIRKLWKQWRG